MQAFADFAGSLLSGTRLLCLSLALGSIPWALVVLGRERATGDAAAMRRCLSLMAAGAFGVAACQAMTLALKAAVLASYLGPGAYASFAETLQFRAGGVQVVLALVLAAATLWLRRAPVAVGRWWLAGSVAVLLAATGAWLVHAAGRLEERAPLMLLTLVHQMAAAVWVGGVVQLTAAKQPGLVGRFSRLAITAVIVLVLAAMVLTWKYVGSQEGLIGSGYGSLLLTKAALMAAALALGGFNFLAGRRAQGGDRGALGRVPAFVQTESILLAILLFAAAGLSAQPPPIDTRGEQATWADVREVFRPKWPSLTTPSVAIMADDDARTIVGAARTPAAYGWSNFSHNVAGLALLAMSLLALAAWCWPRSSARHWPLGFVGLGVFVFLRTSANDGIWPFGSVSMWGSLFGDAEMLQHRLGAVLAITVGVLEWRARTHASSARGAYLFPALVAAGGVLLLTHSHAAFELKSSYLIQVTHTVMGALAVFMACGRLLELRLASPANRVAGVASTIAMLLIALVLVFYREANVVVDRVQSHVEGVKEMARLVAPQAIAPLQSDRRRW